MNIIAVITMAIAGLIHLYIAPEHWTHAPAHGLFFGLSGAAQLVWALLFRRQTSRWLYIGGLALSGGMLALWIFTQVWTPPFGESAEPVDIWMISSKAAEFIGFISLITAGLAHRNAARSWLEAVAVALVGGILFYGVGYAAQPMLPNLMSLGSDHHDDGAAHSDDHSDTEDHHDEADAHGEESAPHSDTEDHHNKTDADAHD